MIPNRRKRIEKLIRIARSKNHRPCRNGVRSIRRWKGDPKKLNVCVVTYALKHIHQHLTDEEVDICARAFPSIPVCWYVLERLKPLRFARLMRLELSTYWLLNPRMSALRCPLKRRIADKALQRLQSGVLGNVATGGT